MIHCDNYQFKAIVGTTLAGLANQINPLFVEGWQYIPNSTSTFDHEILMILVKRQGSMENAHEVLARLAQERLELEKQDELRRSRP